MVDIKSISNIAPMVALLAPGLIVILVRALVVGKRIQIPTHSEAILRYFVISIVYYVGVFAFTDVDVISGEYNSFSRPWIWPLVILLVPVLLGFLWGMEVRKQFFGRLAVRLGISGMDTGQAAATAWDWRFRNTEGGHVIVTLKDDSQYAGLLGRVVCVV